MFCIAGSLSRHLKKAEAAIAALIACTALLLTAVICGTVLRDFADPLWRVGYLGFTRCCEARRS